MNHEDESGNGGWQASERLSEASEYRNSVNHVTRNQDLEAGVELMEIALHGSTVETPSLFRRGRQSDRESNTR